MGKIRLWLVLKIQEAIEEWGDDWFLSRDLQPLVQKGERQVITPNRIGQHMRPLKERGLVEAVLVRRNHKNPQVSCQTTMFKYRRRRWDKDWRVKQLFLK